MSFKSVPTAEVSLPTCFIDGKVDTPSNSICLYNDGETDCHIKAIANNEGVYRLALGLTKTSDNCSVKNDIFLLSHNLSSYNRSPISSNKSFSVLACETAPLHIHLS